MKRSGLLVLLATLVAASAMAEPCRPIDGLAPLLRPGRILLLGELHGTEESPAFALDVACHAVQAGLPVVVGLELLDVEQAPVDAFLDSNGTPDDRKALLSGRIWQRDYQDGRNSRAMADLIDGARRLRRDGGDVRVSLFDASGAAGGQQRDRAMGANLVALARAAPEKMLIVLAGNMHTRTTRGNARNADYEPMGYVLSKGTSPERVIALDVAHAGGSAWICAPGCGATSLGGKHGESPWTIEVDDDTRPPGHQGWYRVGRITASPPATRPDLAQTGVSVDPAPPQVSSSAPTTAVAPEGEDDSPLSELEAKVQGGWQAFDFTANTRRWTIRFDERRFHAGAGTEDWYKGRILLRPDEAPAQIDFAIDDCQCSFKGMTSDGIYYWEGETLVIAAPRPGSPRPARFNEMSGEMMRLRRLAEQ